MSNQPAWQRWLPDDLAPPTSDFVMPEAVEPGAELSTAQQEQLLQQQLAMLQTQAHE